MDAIESFFNSNFTEECEPVEKRKTPEKNMNKSPTNKPEKIAEKPIKLVEKPTNKPEKIAEKPIDQPNPIESKAKKPLLDPLSVIIKLAIISNKPIGTKILIKDHIVHIQEPGIFQGLTRYIHKTNRNDLRYLYNPIQIACKKYLGKQRKIPEIVQLFICAQYGIVKLIETYQTNDVISICLNYYHCIIQNFTKDLFQNIFRDDEITPLYTDPLLHNLDTIWTPEKIKVVLDMIHFLSDDKMAADNVKSLDVFMQNIDKHTQVIFTSSLL